MIFRVIFLLTLAIFVDHGDAQRSYKNPQATNNESEKVYDGIKKFSLNIVLATALAAPNTNILMSPFSIWSLLTMLGEGSGGNTLLEIRRALHFIKNRDVMRDIYKQIDQKFHVSSRDVQINTFNGFYIQRGIDILPAYSNLLRNSYAVSLKLVDMGDPKTVNIINDDVKRSTRNKITSVASADDLKDGSIILTNAIYFKGIWKNLFDAKLTTRENFFDENGRVLGQVNMMTHTGNYLYADVNKFEAQTIELPYGQDGKFSMIIMLPNDGVSLQKFIYKFEEFPVENFYDELKAAAKYEAEPVELYLPRFKIETDLALDSVLRNLGIYDLFEPGVANLKNITLDDSFYLSHMFHKGAIEVTEEGTVAAAITVAQLDVRFQAASFKANKPFVYIILEKESNVILFAGVYVKPELY